MPSGTTGTCPIPLRAPARSFHSNAGRWLLQRASAHTASLLMAGGPVAACHLRAVAVSLLIVIGGTVPASAVAANWTCTSDYFDSGGCWSTATPPGEIEDAVFNSAGVQTVQWDSIVLGNWQGSVGSLSPVVTNQGLRVENGDVTIRSDTGTPFTYNITGNADIINGGRLRIGLPGQPMVVDVGVGTRIASGGIVDITGTGSILDIAGALEVGQIGSGTLNIAAGGVVSADSGAFSALTSPGSGSTVTVTGPGSQLNIATALFWGGNSATITLQDQGVMNVVGVPGDIGTVPGTAINIDGGTLVARNFAVEDFNIGSSLGTSGSHTATDQGIPFPEITAANLFVGKSGAGLLNINGATVLSQVGIIGHFAGGNGATTVNGPGSLWVNLERLIVGRNGTGTLNVQAGGIVETTDVIIGDNVSGSGTVTVNGFGSVLESDPLTPTVIGDQGTGELNVLGGGRAWFGTLNGPTGGGIIGRDAGSNGTVNVIGGGSQWVLGKGGLDVGRSGSGVLNIEAGGEVLSLGFSVSDTDIVASNIGRFAGSTGMATVTGASSQWTTAGGLTVGILGNGTLDVESGGSVTSYWASIGNFAGSVGAVTVTGPGSEMTTTGNPDVPTCCGNLWVGEFGIGSLGILAGGVVTTDTFGVIGVRAGGTGEVVVTGPGSQWNMDAGLHVGDAGVGILTVADGGVVMNTEGRIARGAGSSGQVTVTGAGSQWHSLNQLHVGDSGNGTLNVENGGQVNSALSISIGASAGSSGAVTVTGPGSELNSTSNWLFVGEQGNGSLTIENGGVVQNTHGFIGSGATGTGTVVVSGPGSQWINGLSLQMGVAGGSTLTVQDQGRVTIGTDIINNAGSSTVNIEDDGTLEVFGNIHVDTFNIGTLLAGVGHHTVRAQLLEADQVNVGNGILNVELGGVVSNIDGSIGAASGSAGLVRVTGAGSQWNNSGSLSIGLDGDGTLLVENGGAVVSANANIGINLPSISSATVTGPGSSWTTGSLDVGQGSTATLNVLAGGLMQSNNTSIGTLANSSGAATVSGAGSQWNDSGVTSIGNNQGNGVLLVEAGGILNSSAGQLGVTPGATGIATVTGPGTRWNSASFLSVGESGVGTLNIAAGGVVSTGSDSWLGTNPGAAGVTTVTGIGSHWDNSGSLSVGEFGTGALHVEAGALVSNIDAFLGKEAGATGAVTVTGPGSTWNNSGQLYVGFLGDGTLTVADGGEVHSIGGGIAPIAGSAGGMITVTGAGSRFIAAGSNFNVGGTGSLNVENGGYVSTGETWVDGAGAGGLVTVTGPGSQWDPDPLCCLIIRGNDSGPLAIEAGGTVNSNESWIGTNGGSSGIAIVSGGGSLWNAGSLDVGQSGTGVLDVVDGGQVTSGNARVGHFASATGTANVSGTGASWLSNQLYVGWQGNGTLNVEDGGRVESIVGGGIGVLAGSTGLVHVRGANSILIDSGAGFDVGSSGNGTLLVEAGGSVQTGGESWIGGAPAGIGTVTVTGPGSLWNSLGCCLLVGGSGAGNLNIGNGGTVQSGESWIGTNAGSMGSATVHGPGSAWLTSNLDVGQSGNGSLAIADGGFVLTNDSTIGLFAGAIGMVDITGPDSRLIVNNNLQIGPDGAGEINLGSGGLVTVGNTLTVGPNGTLNMLEGNGGVSTSSFDASQGIFNFQDGLLSVEGGAFTPASGINVSGAFNPRLILENGASSISAGLAAIGASAGGTGALDIRNGSTVQSGGGIVGVLGGNGRVDVEGVGSSWLAMEGLVIGDEPNLALQQLGISDQGIGLVRVADTAVLDASGNDVRVNSQGRLELAGGDVFAAAVEVNGTLSGYGNINTRVVAGVRSVISATGGILSIGSAGLVNSFAADGTLNVGPAASLHIETAGTFASLAAQNYLNSGSITSTYAVVLGAGRNLIGSGSVDTRFIGAGGSLVVANGGDLVLGDASAFDGFNTAGSLNVSSNTVTLNDADEAVLGSFTRIGDDFGGAGSLIAANGLLVNFGSTVSGYGQISGDILNNGLINGAGPGFFDLLDLQGLVNGVGDFAGTVAFSGGFSPGLSPTITNGENFLFNSVLELELGGLTPGAEHDQVQATGFVGLGGLLDIVLIDGWVPSLDDAYVLILADEIFSLDAQNQPVSPRFAQVNFPGVAAGLRFLLEFNLNPAGQDSLVLRVAAVPLPGAIWMLVPALAVLVRRRRVHNNRSASRN